MSAPAAESTGWTQIKFDRADGVEVSAVICRAEIMPDTKLPVIPLSAPKPTKEFFLENEVLLYYVPDDVDAKAVDFLVNFITTTTEVGSRLGERAVFFTNGLKIEEDPNDSERLALSSCGTDPGLENVADYNELWQLVPEGMYVVHTMRPELMDTGWIMAPKLTPKDN
jgi:hypothetical protein